MCTGSDGTECPFLWVDRRELPHPRDIRVREASRILDIVLCEDLKSQSSIVHFGPDSQVFFLGFYFLGLCLYTNKISAYSWVWTSRCIREIRWLWWRVEAHWGGLWGLPLDRRVRIVRNVALVVEWGRGMPYYILKTDSTKCCWRWLSSKSTMGFNALQRSVELCEGCLSCWNSFWKVLEDGVSDLPAVDMCREQYSTRCTCWDVLWIADWSVLNNDSSL